MIDPKFHEEQKKSGVMVIRGHERGRFVICEDKDGIHGVDDDGEPIELLNGQGGPHDPRTVIYIPADKDTKVFCGNTKIEVNTKMKNKTPDFEIKEKKETQLTEAIRVIADGFRHIIKEKE